MNKIIFILLLISFGNCTARIISPGITSSQRLNHLGTTNQLEATLYYGKDFEMNSFYILPDLKEEVIYDKNNILDEGNNNSNALESFKNSNKVLLLFETCMDKNKDEKEILKKFQFTLNNQSTKDTVYYPYPYTYYMHGNKKKKYASYYETFQDNEDSYDYLYCTRFLLEFPKSSEKEGTNILQVKTSQGNIAEFQYQVRKNQFQSNSNQTDSDDGSTVSTGKTHQFWGKGSNSQLVRIKKK